jgi:hypothetical protein
MESECPGSVLEDNDRLDAAVSNPRSARHNCTTSVALIATSVISRFDLLHGLLQALNDLRMLVVEVVILPKILL